MQVGKPTIVEFSGQPIVVQLPGLKAWIDDVVEIPDELKYVQVREELIAIGCGYTYDGRVVSTINKFKNICRR